MSDGEGRKALPEPVTVTDILLGELIHEIRGLRADMQPTPLTPPGGTVELREPPKRRRS